MKTADRAFVIVVVAVVVAVGYFIPRPTPIVNVAPDVTVDAMELANALSVPAYDRDPVTGQIRAWPGTEGIEAETFREDCRDVCSAPGMSIEEGEFRVRPRVLYTDPEHLVCVCLRARGFVARYVGWERRQQ